MQFSIWKQLQYLLCSKRSKAIKYFVQTKTGVQKYTMHNIAVLAISLIFKKLQHGCKKKNSFSKKFVSHLFETLKCSFFLIISELRADSADYMSFLIKFFRQQLSYEVLQHKMLQKSVCSEKHRHIMNKLKRLTHSCAIGLKFQNMCKKMWV